MKIRFLYLLLPLLCCACVATKKYSAHLSENIIPQTIETREWLTILSPQNAFIGSTSKDVKHSVVPALLYWRVRTDYNNIIDEFSAFTSLNNYIARAADSMKLKDSLGNKKLLIEIRQLPHQFFYSERKHVIVLLLGAADWSKEIITPAATDLEANVSIIDNDNTSSSFPITIKNKEQTTKNVSIRKHYNYWSFFDRYISNYKKELKRMAIELILKIKEKKE